MWGNHFIMVSSAILGCLFYLDLSFLLSFSQKLSFLPECFHVAILLYLLPSMASAIIWTFLNMGDLLDHCIVDDSSYSFSFIIVQSHHFCFFYLSAYHNILQMFCSAHPSFSAAQLWHWLLWHDLCIPLWYSHQRLLFNPHFQALL